MRSTVLATAIALSACAISPTMTTVIEPGVVPNLSAGAVANIAFDEMRMMAATPAVDVHPIRKTVLRAMRNSQLPDDVAVDAPGSTIVWFVRSEGTFASLRGRQSDPIVGSSGYFVIRDDSGQIVGMGIDPP